MTLPPYGWMESIQRSLAQVRPGGRAHARMIPSYRRHGPDAADDGRSWKAAAVLILLYPDLHGRLSFPLVLRSPHLRHHRGEVGLPGGSLEAEESPADAALREAEEELCLEAGTTASIRLLGGLSPIRVPPSGFEVRPFVGALPQKPEMKPRRGEIDGIVDFPLSGLFEAGRIKSEDRNFEGRQWQVPYFELEERKVWGATAMILAELSEMLASMAGKPG